MTEALSPLVLPGAYRDQNVVGTASGLNSTVGAYVNACRIGFITSTAWSAANLVAYYPLVIAAPFTVKLIYWQNGTTPSGNIEVGVYDEAGNRKGTSGSTAAGTTVAVQTVTPTAFLLNGPARYYLAVTCSANTYTLAGPSTAPTAGVSGALGVMTETTGSFGLTNPWGSVAVLTSAELLVNAGICNGTVM